MDEANNRNKHEKPGRRTRGRRPLALMSCLWAVLALASAVGGQEAPTDPASAGGIHVHGHWTIEVFKGDSLVAAREFDNALASAPGGEELLAKVLTYRYGFATQNLSSERPVYIAVHLASGEVLRIGKVEDDGSTVFVSTPTSGEDAGKIVVDASYPSISAHSVEAVEFVLNVRAGLSGPENGLPLTRKDLGTPISVGENEIVKVNVTISFGDG